MTKVVSFTQARRSAGPTIPASSRPAGGVSGSRGEVIIFPGVRIERHGDVDLHARIRDAAGKAGLDGRALGGPAG